MAFAAIAGILDSSSDEEEVGGRARDFSIDSVSDLLLYRSTRLSRPTFLFIKNLLNNRLERMTRRSNAISVDLQLYLAFQFFASGGFQWLVGNTVHVSQATASRTIHAVVGALVEIAPQFIRFPEINEYAANKQQFYRIGARGQFNAGFPNVLGAIDCTHIQIQKPAINPEQYVDRFFHHSINVQLTCLADLRIINVLAAYPGGNHDSYIWRNSRLRQELVNGTLPDGWLIGMHIIYH